MVRDRLAKVNMSSSEREPAGLDTLDAPDKAAMTVNEDAAPPSDALEPSPTDAAETEPSEPETAEDAEPPTQVLGAGRPETGSAGDAPARPYPAPAETPTQVGPRGIRYDFNDGCRVLIPDAEGGKWRVRLRDIDTGNILFETRLLSGRINSSKRYYIACRIEVWLDDELVLEHDYSAKDQAVIVNFPVGTIGDTLGWFPYAAKFQRKHGCRLTCAMAERLIPLFQAAYPDIRFQTHEQVDTSEYYATYNMGLFFTDKDHIRQPCDFRLVGLHRTAAYILGVDPDEEPPSIVLDDDSRPIEEPYVCIGVQSTTQAKYWNNPAGWREIVKFLKESGYRVICIDQRPVHGHGLTWNHLPHGCEDETGDRPLQERARWLRHAEFFIGLSSGLSWLAWAAGCPVVMISGFTHPTNEFNTKHRVINYHTCNSCWNDPALMFDHKDFLWCPRHAGTSRQFECTRLITVDAVKAALRGVPGFGETGGAPSTAPNADASARRARPKA
jgi:autotransporter strand-loop-strand O-heptosyltransferase